MIRRIQISLRPSEALAALVTLHGPVVDGPATPGVSAATHAFGARMGQEVVRALDVHARSLEVLGACLDWLERRGVARLSRARVRGAARPLAWQCATELRVDVRPLVKQVADEVIDPDSPARATAWALRTVLRHLAGGGLHACEVRAGSERVPAAEALASYDAALASVGYGASAAPPVRLAHLASRSKRRDEPVEAPAGAPPAVKPEVKAAVTEKPRAKVETASAERPRAKAEASEKARSAPRSNVGGFGSLPDDAVPEDRRAGEVYSARGLTLDAEFFLVEATIAVWPCDLKSLERGRRLVVSKLHPDRAGEASTGSFHRAIKGHAELMKKLSAVPQVKAPEPVDEAPKTPEKPVVVEAPKVVEVTPQSAPERGASKPKRARAKPVEAAPATASAVTTATVSVAPAASGSTYEWPPRPAEVVPPPPPVVIAEPAVATSVSAATSPAKRRSKRVAAAAKRTHDDAQRFAV